MAPSCCHRRKRGSCFWGTTNTVHAASPRHARGTAISRWFCILLLVPRPRVTRGGHGWGSGTWWDGEWYGAGGPGDSTRCKIELQRVSEPKRRASGLGEAVHHHSHHHHHLPQHAPPPSPGPCQQGCDSSQPANCAKGIGGEGQVRRRPLPRRATSSKDVDGRKELLMRWCGSTGKARSVRRASTWTSTATGCMVL